LEYDICSLGGRVQRIGEWMVQRIGEWMVHRALKKKG